LGYGEDGVKNLRQTLLSATVENKSKRVQLAKEYQERGNESLLDAAVKSFSNQEALHEVLNLLYEAGKSGGLNNKNIPNLVENYFFEMSFIVHELARLLAPGGHIVMVNDNVQYIGEEVPVDLILSDFAASAGLTVKHIWVLPRGKGNSSQQMGIHGRNELRKCVYVWSKPIE
jgi:Tfp pilus assembly protein PilZ